MRASFRLAMSSHASAVLQDLLVTPRVLLVSLGDRAAIANGRRPCGAGMMRVEGLGEGRGSNQRGESQRNDESVHSTSPSWSAVPHEKFRPARFRVTAFHFTMTCLNARRLDVQTPKT